MAYLDRHTKFATEHPGIAAFSAVLFDTWRENKAQTFLQNPTPARISSFFPYSSSS